MLTWNVYLDDFNNRRIRTLNIFQHESFLDGCRKAAKKYADDKTGFEAQIEKLLKYYFWSKCEYEIVLDAWPPSPRFHPEKVDVYDQVKLNWPVFISWLWSNREALTKSRRRS